LVLRARDKAVPTPVGFPPTIVPTNTPLQITVGYANNTCSTTNFYSGQIAFASTADTQNGTLSNFAAACYIQWDTSGNVTLYDNGTQYWGVMGQATTLSGSLCSVNLQYSSGSFSSSTGLYNVQLDLTFLTTFVGQHAVWSYATDTYGTSSPWTNLSWNGGKGMLTVSSPPPVNITIATSPSGRSIVVDGNTSTAPQTFSWTPGAQHTIGVTSPQGSGSTQYLFGTWSDSGAQTHTITVPSSPTTYTATFTTQYYLTTTATAGGTISPGSGWYNSGVGVWVSAAAYGGYKFVGFSGSLSGSATPQNLTMNGPASITATFSSQGAIALQSLNQVSNSGISPISSYRWEPSSADSGGWISSWHDVGTVRGSPDYGNTHAYTSMWSGSTWSAPTEHRTPSGVPAGQSCGFPPASNSQIMDTYTYWDAWRMRYALVAVDYGGVGNSAWVQYSSDSTGLTWNPMTLAMEGCLAGPVQWDFPSVAVSSAGSNAGRIVVGASSVQGTTGGGYWTSYSDDGVNWHGPYQVNGNLGGGTSRIVWSASGFHAFILQLVDSSQCDSRDIQQGGCEVLQHWISQDGMTWALHPTKPIVATYGVPLPSSMTAIISSPITGALSYARTPDAVSASGLGWVVAYPVNIGGLNGINVSTESGVGFTVSWTSDLFSHGIATSASGDWYLTYQMYQSQTPLYLQQRAVYGPPGCQSQSCLLGATIQTNIDPSLWWYYNSDLVRCSPAQPGVDAYGCYAAGDWFRPAMNTFTGASVPMILGSGNLNDLFQAFIVDPPPVSNVPQFLPTVEPFVNGSDISGRAVLTPAHLGHIALGHYTFRISSMGYAALAKRGVVH